jgi:hypothetical protein
MTRRATLVVVLALAATAILAAPVHAASTRAEYIAQVDPICAHELAGAKRTLGGVNGDLAKGRNKQAGGKFARATKVFIKGVNHVGAVPPPTADAALIGQWIQMLQGQIPLARKATRLLKQDARQSRIETAIRRLFNLSDRTQALVKDYGFSDCSFM